MALITCPECGRQISDKAAACVGCGYPLNVEKKEVSKNKTTSSKRKLPRFAIELIDKYKAEIEESHKDKNPLEYLRYSW